ncbi:uncharacterized protein FOMMEDRAFT_150499 [Fomitiporia mediterranea MF3/22]|uniref:uncharacterized protein n=1 Tax=Fomitiporia mediterranea (strain MF3/22) TaxID=694068 RepID=UPI0004407916|nr:uncharacterized protein FOMMEDRAFT_150499 [Fomitiporia mediterranea MF3/22]EJD07905.1 hypothetical protein FOMMEDRAFT_150499 [Fomitiporia mediterranea MF3/22]
MSFESASSTTALGDLPDFARYPDSGELKMYQGNCHCRKFTFELLHPPLEVKKPVLCNCTFCTRTGAIFVSGAERMLHITSPSATWDEFTRFENKTKTTAFHFCPTCGNLLFFTVSGMPIVGVNVRMFEGIEIDKLGVDHFDGRNEL